MKPRLSDDPGLPVDRADLPGKPNSSQFSGSSLINVRSAIRMALEKTGRNSFSLRALNSRTKDRRLRFAPGKQREFFGLQNRSNAHRDRVSGYICFTAEVPCCISAS